MLKATEPPTPSASPPEACADSCAFAKGTKDKIKPVRIIIFGRLRDMGKLILGWQDKFV
jgi:hypothetical protein